MSMNPVSFKGIYKVTMPNVKTAKDEKEKERLIQLINKN